MEKKDNKSNDTSLNKDSEILRDERQNIMIKFENLKKLKNIDFSEIKELLDHCNTIQEIIEIYLNKLRDLKDKDYIPELIYYYTILSPEICRNHGINKRTEKETFFEIVENFIQFNYLEFKAFAEAEYSNIPKEIESIYKSVITSIKDQKEIDENKKYYIRWDNIYNSPIDFKDIYNEEYFYYKMSNSLLRDFMEGLISINQRKTAVKIIIESFKKLEPQKANYPKYFEFICFALLNGEIENSKENNELKIIIDCIKDELNQKYYGLEEIEKCLKELNVSFIINNNDIEIKKKNFTILIKNYTNYNFNKDILIGLLSKRESTYENDLKANLNFNAYINEQIYFNGLLNQIILNYSKSNLSKNSIELLFNINQSNYKTLFDEVTTEKIMKYIYYIPYRSDFDTERTFKIFSKIIIDPVKNLYADSISHKFLNYELGQNIKKFVNIVLRKFKFEHEHQHLVTILLFYLYINSKRRINSLPKEILENIIKILSEEIYAKKKNNINILKEAGYQFEVFCYGRKQTHFSLKQLLFIANEDNDKLDCKTFKENYNKCANIKLEEMLENFPKNQTLSKLVNDIKNGFKEEAKLQNDYKQKAENILGNNIVSKIEDIKDLISIEEIENMQIAHSGNAYNNYVYEKKYKHY